jgi:hypothetical protein
MGACAKKDSDFAAKYAKNAAGGSAINADAAGNADEVAKTNGISLDVLQLNKSANGSEQVITSVLIVNQKQIPVTTRHNAGLQVSRGSTQIDGFTVVYNAVCGNQACDPVYITAEAYKPGNNSAIIQLGYRKYFSVQNLDRYQFFTGNEIKNIISGSSFSANDMTNTSVMVGYLNQNINTGYAQ